MWQDSIGGCKSLSLHHLSIEFKLNYYFYFLSKIYMNFVLCPPILKNSFLVPKYTQLQLQAEPHVIQPLKSQPF